MKLKNSPNGRDKRPSAILCVESIDRLFVAAVVRVVVVRASNGKDGDILAVNQPK